MARGGKREGAGRPQGATNRATRAFKEVASEYSEQALSVLVDVMENGDSAAARVSAANSILDRAYGKPKQAVDVDANVRAAVTRIEREIVRSPHSNG